MTHYAVGDIQGCYSALEKLLTKIQFNPVKDILWCTGDLVNRGAQSLEVLRFFKSLGNRHRTVLGNHDLHLLAVVYGVREMGKGDTLQAILDAPDKNELIDWLRCLPMLIYDKTLGYVMTHAGLAPSWTLETAQSLACELEVALRGEWPHHVLEQLFGNTPDVWADSLTGSERLRSVVNYLTRMRFCDANGRLELTYKGTLADKPAGLMPWFDVPNRSNADLKIIFGHWAALGGKADVPNVYPLDTGCVWGNCLTAMRLEDGQRFHVSCHPDTDPERSEGEVGGYLSNTKNL